MTVNLTYPFYNNSMGTTKISKLEIFQKNWEVADMSPKDQIWWWWSI